MTGVSQVNELQAKISAIPNCRMSQSELGQISFVPKEIETSRFVHQSRPDLSRAVAYMACHPLLTADLENVFRVVAAVRPPGRQEAGGGGGTSDREAVTADLAADVAVVAGPSSSVVVQQRDLRGSVVVAVVDTGHSHVVSGEGGDAV